MNFADLLRRLDQIQSRIPPGRCRRCASRPAQAVTVDWPGAAMPPRGDPDPCPSCGWQPEVIAIVVRYEDRLPHQ